MPSNSRSLAQFPSIVSFVTANSTLVMANSSTSGTSYVGTALGIGTTSLTGNKLNVGGNLTGLTSSYAINVGVTVLSDVTVSASSFRSALATQSATFTLSSLYHFIATSGSFGLNSTVSNQYGFLANSTLSAATNNFGFYGSIAAASNAYNFYMAGTANNYMAGSLGIGSTALTGFSLRLNKTITGATTSYGIYSAGAIQPDVTTAYYNVSASSSSANGGISYTVSAVYGYAATQGSISADSIITSQGGFVVASALTGGTNNFGFRGQIAAATGRYNLYMDGTADNYLAGSLGIGSVPSAAQNLRLAKSITGATVAYGYVNQSTIASDVTSQATLNYTGLITAASAFTVSSVIYYFADQNTIGSSSAVTTQQGYFASSSLTGATNNYGFRGQIAAAANRWNLYMDGTAANYLAGNLLIGNTTQTNALAVNGVITEIANGTYYNVVTQYDIGTAANQVPLNQYLGSMAYQDSAAVAVTSLTSLGNSYTASMKIPNMKEVANVYVTAATGTINYDITNQSIVYFTANSAANWTINFRASSGTTLNTLMSTGESMSATFLAPQGATAYYNNVVQVDGTTTGVTTRWQGGIAPTSGNINSIDVYMYSIIKTGSATYTILASQSKFA